MKKLAIKALKTLLILVAMLCFSSLQAQFSDWPRNLALDESIVTIYSPQVEQMDGDSIRLRAALAWRATPDSEPVFGAGWFESQVEIDASGKIVHLSNPKVMETRFPKGTDDLQSELSTALALQSNNAILDLSVDELDKALQLAEAESSATQKINTTPPKIIYRDHPALLVSIDGEPVLREIENSPYEAVINTPYPLISNAKHYYLNAAKNVWYRADEATGPYRFESKPPADLVAMVNVNETEVPAVLSEEVISAANAPEIVVSTVPAELIVTEGPAAFVPLVDDLLVLQNSDDDVFMHLESQDFYIVLAGRWYHANSLNGPWTYRQSDDLPEAFANIPENSEQADSRVYVAGTEEAQDAVLDAQVPRTIAVARGEADIEVKYDGEPVYQPVDGTGLVYIENTGSTVLQSNGLYYLVENGVWYVSGNPSGPWQVADHRPEQVDSILPTSPVYNVKYVRVYDSTPEVVYVGYTPGYMGSYVYSNTVFYGSGWYHRPWVSPYYYYPRHSTWGLHASYDLWSGWNFGLSWAWGPFSVSYYPGGYWHHGHYWHHRNYGRWGPGRYRSRPVHYRGYHGNGHRRYADNRGRGDYRGRSGSNRGDSGRDRNNYRGSNSGQLNDSNSRGNSQRNRYASGADRQTGTTGRRQQNYSGLKKGERNRVDPVETNVSNLNVRTAEGSQQQRRASGRSSENNRRATRNAGSSGSRQQNYTGLKKGERNRADPVETSVSNLNVRTAEGSQQQRRTAGRSSENNRRPTRNTGSSGSRQQNYTGLKKGERNRADPVETNVSNLNVRTAEGSQQQRRTAGRSSENNRRPTRNTGSSGSRQQNYTGLKKGERNRTQPIKPSQSNLNRGIQVAAAQSSRSGRRASQSKPAPVQKQKSRRNSNQPKVASKSRREKSNSAGRTRHSKPQKTRTRRE